MKIDEREDLEHNPGNCVTQGGGGDEKDEISGAWRKEDIQESNRFRKAKEIRLIYHVSHLSLLFLKK